MNLAATAVGLYLWEWDFGTDRVWVTGPLAELMGANQRTKVDFSELFQRVHPDDQKLVATACENSRMGKADLDSVHRRVLIDGRIIWVASRGRVEFDERRKPVRMRGISMDITARMEAEERARENEGRFLVMANSSPVIMWASGLDGSCTFCNKAWLDFTGRPLDEQVGYGWAESIHPEDRARCVNTVSEAFDARRPFTQEYRVRRHDGQYRWVSDHGVPRYDAERNFMGYIGSCVDVTERKEAEEIAQRSQQELAHASRVSVLGQMAESLAHELNQPLTAIVSNGQAAQRFMKADRRNEEEVRDALKEIVEQGQRAGEIIAGLHAMLKSDLGQMGVQDMNRAVKEVVELVRTDLVIRHVTPVLRLDPQLPTVRGHGVQLRQVVLNLVMNACDAMANVPADRRRLTIESRGLTADEVEVSVADSGPGFPDEMLPHVFEPFHTTKPKGLGLGLAICQSIIEMHGGRVVAANNNDEGATVTFTLPRRNGSDL